MVRILKKPKNAKRKNKEVEGLSDSVASKVWEAGIDKLEEGEELQCDPSAYNALHAFHIGWPCMSFDVLRDSLGMVRTEFSHTAYCVAGTQVSFLHSMLLPFIHCSPFLSLSFFSFFSF
uniref:Histone-binding protein RBBP4-like N-terminal domain-containing protein n=1 Tax=Solanum lycopersicum TaxID=4081 RepID=K4BYC7_SOLLC